MDGVDVSKCRCSRMGEYYLLW